MPKPIGSLGKPTATPPIAPIATEPSSEPETTTLEQALADRLADDVDLSLVATHLISAIKRRFIVWLASAGSAAPITEIETLRVLEGGDRHEAA